MRCHCSFLPWRGGTSYNGLYEVDAPPEGYLFQATGIQEGRGFISRGIGGGRKFVVRCLKVSNG